MSDKKRLGLTSNEFANLMQAVRYGVIIVVVILLTFIVVAGISGLLGYVPPSPAGLDTTPEVTQSF